MSDQIEQLSGQYNADQLFSESTQVDSCEDSGLPGTGLQT